MNRHRKRMCYYTNSLLIMYVPVLRCSLLQFFATIEFVVAQCCGYEFLQFSGFGLPSLFYEILCSCVLSFAVTPVTDF